MKKILIPSLKILIAVSILTYLVRSGKLDFTEIPIAFAHPWWVCLAIVVTFSQVFVATLRWKLLLRGVGVQESFKNLFHFTWIGSLFNNVMLGSVGGDVVKIFYVVKHFPSKKAVTGMTVLLDRVLGLYCMVLTLSLSFVFAPESLLKVPAIQALKMGSWTFVAVTLVCLPLLFSRRIIRWLPLKGVLAEISEAILKYRNHKRLILGALGLSCIINLNLIVILYSLTRALGQNVEIIDFRTMCFIAPAGIITLAIPVAPAGLGVGQVAFAQLFKWVGSPIPTLGANAATLFQIVQMSMNLLGIFSYLTHRPQKASYNKPVGHEAAYEL